jgi:urease accessory protein
MAGPIEGRNIVHSRLTLALAVLAAIAAPTTALAHVGLGDAHGFIHGFGHPISGLDHILAMVAVGAFATYLGGRALWLVPTTFVALMAVGAGLGASGIAAPLVETGIAASVIVLGLALALQWSLPTIGAMALVGFFAIFHGHAHGSEMPPDAAGLQYALGFVLATALLHFAGIRIALGVGRIGTRSQFALRAGGGAMALAGVGLLTGYL